MPAISNFASVKLPAQLVNQAKEVAQPLRRSAAGQIEYWATLGRVVEHSGLTVREACTAIEAYESSARTAREVPPTLKAAPADSASDSLEAVKRRMLAANADGSLQTHICSIVSDNCQKAQQWKAA